jgi:hypothetical protein
MIIPEIEVVTQHFDNLCADSAVDGGINAGQCVVAVEGIFNYGIDPDQKFLDLQAHWQEMGLNMLRAVRFMYRMYVDKNGEMPIKQLPIELFPDDIRPISNVGTQFLDFAYLLGFYVGKTCMCTNFLHGQNALHRDNGIVMRMEKYSSECERLTAMYKNALDYLHTDEIRDYLATISHDELKAGITRMFSGGRFGGGARPSHGGKKKDRKKRRR